MTSPHPDPTDAGATASEYYVNGDTLDVMVTPKGSTYIGDQKIVCRCATDAGGIEMAVRIAEFLNERDTLLSDLAAARAEVLAKDSQIEALRKALEWQPIETAPRDGTRFLWCSDNGKWSKSAFIHAVIFWPEYRDCFETGWWQPLSVPPALQQNGGE